MATKKTAPIKQNEHNDVVMIELDRPRELKLGHKALKRFSALRGCSLFDLEKEVGTYDGTAAMAYCMLTAEDPTLTVEQVDDMLEQVSPFDLIVKVNEAIVKAFPADDGSGETPPKAAGTGEKA